MYNILADYHVRLVDDVYNSTVYSGRVEVVVNGEWGTICDDGWDTSDASVVCRQLGYPVVLGAYSRAHFGQGSGTIWLDDLQCSGEEESLFSCSHIGIGQHNCGHSEDAGVTCSNGKKHCVYKCVQNTVLVVSVESCIINSCTIFMNTCMYMYNVMIISYNCDYSS